MATKNQSTSTHRSGRTFFYESFGPAECDAPYSVAGQGSCVTVEQHKEPLPPLNPPVISEEEFLARLERRVAAYGPEVSPFVRRLGTIFGGLLRPKSVVESLQLATHELGRAGAIAARDGVKAAIKARHSA